MLVVSLEGTITMANRSAEELFGYEPGALLGLQVEQLIPARRRRHVGHRSAYARDPRIRPMGADLDLHALRKDGTEFRVEISLGPVGTGERDAFALATIRALPG